MAVAQHETCVYSHSHVPCVNSVLFKLFQTPQLKRSPGECHREPPHRQIGRPPLTYQPLSFPIPSFSLRTCVPFAVSRAAHDEVDRPVIGQLKVHHRVRSLVRYAGGWGGRDG